MQKPTDSLLSMEKKKVNITLAKDNWENLQALVKALGWPKNWLSCEIDKLVAGLLIVAKQAKEDAENRLQMTEEEAKKRYEELMRRMMEQQ